MLASFSIDKSLPGATPVSDTLHRDPVPLRIVGEALNVLVIDDDQEDLDIIVSALEDDINIGEIASLTNSELATQMLDKGLFRPDVIFLDLNMPRMNGFDVLDAIRSRDILSKLPIVILTTSHHSADMRAAFQGLATSYVIKPVSHTILKSKISKISTCLIRGETLERSL